MDALNLLWDKLALQYKCGSTAPGTRGYSQFCHVLVIIKWVMATSWQAAFAFNKVTTSKTDFVSISSNKYVACYYDSNWWVRLVQNVNSDENDFEIIFLHPPIPSNSFTWQSDKMFVGYLISMWSDKSINQRNGYII